MKKKIEFSKILLYLDYIVMISLIIISIFYPDIISIAIAWIGQVAVSTGFYFWKARHENKIKIPMTLLHTLNEEEENKLDLTQIILSLIDKD